MMTVRAQSTLLKLHLDRRSRAAHLGFMTAAELRDLILRQLAQENGGGTVRWRKVLGDLKVYSRTTHAHCNWDARPSGPPADVAAVESAVDRVRLKHSFVEA